MISIFIPGKPVGKGRPRFGKGRTYTPAATVRAEKKIANIAREIMADDPPLEGAVAMQVEVAFPIPKSWSKARKANAILHTNKPDLDNILKLICDAINEIVYIDDSQVCSVTISKKYDADADGFTRVWAWPVEGDPYEENLRRKRSEN